MFDGKAFGQEIVAATKAHVDKVVAPLLARIDELEKRLSKESEQLFDSICSTETTAKAWIADAIAAIPPQEPQEFDPEQFRQIARDIVDERLAAFPLPAAPELPDIPALVSEAAAALPKAPTLDEVVAAIPAPQNGKDADPEQVAALVREEAERILAGWERPKDGLPGEKGDAGQNGIDGAPGKDGIDGKDGRDGLDVKDLFVADGGELVAVFSDGRSKNLGKFRGEDGKPGRDGFGFDDLDVTYDGERTFTIKFARAADVKEFVFRAPIMIYRGVWTERAYETGDTVTWGGSTWHCNQPTTEKPDGASKHWTLSNKKGRDGKDGVVKTEPAKGPIKVG